ncbi:MAG: helicase-related protein, partial [Bacteroidota bacterium]
VESKINKVLEIISKVKGSGLIYCNSRKKTKEVAELLKLNKVNADFYHAGLSNEERNTKQDKWLKNEITMMVCTNAFGMGIDKPDVRVVIHFDSPDCLESYYQEAGRAGRDEKKSYAVLLFNKQDVTMLEQLPQIRFPSIETLKKVYAALANYLQVPADYGEGIFYDFDLQEFTKRFHFDIHEAMYSIKTLEQEGFIEFNEQIFLPSTINFICDKETLYEFEQTHSEFEPLIKTLLRTYQGIFDIPIIISEKQIASLLKQDVSVVKNNLNKLTHHKLISYQSVKEKPQIRFLVDRIKTSDLFINQGNIRKRKKIFEHRIKKMLEYLNNSSVCRNRIICDYFGDASARNCGICDNCLSVNKLKIDAQQFEQIRKNIIEKIEADELTTENLHLKFPGISKSKIEKVMEFLIAEEEIVIHTNNQIIKRKKG